MSRQGRIQLLAAGLLTLALGWLVAPAAVPLYDGVNYPDEPYRYVAPGPGQETAKRPVIASAATDITGGTNPQGFEVASVPEFSPQVSIYVPANSLLPSGNATTATVTATPLAPAGTPPVDGPITGNVYRVTATSGGQPVALAKGTAGTITLRAPVGFKVIPEIDFRASPGGTWKLVQTSKVGNDIFEAPFESLGDYATVLPIHGKTASAGSLHTVVVALAVVLGAAVVALVVVRGVRHIGGAADGLEDEDLDLEDEDSDEQVR